MPWLASTWRSYLTFWPSLGRAILQPGLAGARAPRRAAAALARQAGVQQRQIGRLAGLHAEADADDLGPHRVERAGLGVERDQLGRLQLRSQASKASQSSNVS